MIEEIQSTIISDIDFVDGQIEELEEKLQTLENRRKELTVTLAELTIRHDKATGRIPQDAYEYLNRP